MKLLILSGTGWLGSTVARDAVARGHEVTVLSRGTSEPPRDVTVIRADRDLPDGYDDAAGHWDAVIDVARQPGQVRRALDALASRVEHWIFVSSVSVYARSDEPGADESAELLAPLDAEEMRGPEDYGAAKVACEVAVTEALGADRALLARPGLIGGPGDSTGRSGYWPLRFARPIDEHDRVLVPESSASPVQLIDVRDLAAFLVTAAETRVGGALNLAGPPLQLAEHLDIARVVGGRGIPRPVPSAWLEAQGVAPWMGERSLPLWLPSPDYVGLGDRSTAAATAAGLATRPLAETLADTLRWELGQGPDRPRDAGLSPAEVRELFAALDAED